MRMLLAPLALVFIAGSSAPAYDFGSGVGIVDVDAGGRACLDIANTRLRIGQRRSAARRLVSPDLDGDGRHAYFRSCASAEGLHLTVWSEAPLGRRRFHAYHDLGYDVDPSCTEADVRP